MEYREFDIGGVFTLALAPIDDNGRGYIGEYRKVGDSRTYTFDGSGLSQKKILTLFWDKAREMKVD